MDLSKTATLLRLILKNPFFIPVIDNCIFEDCNLYGADFDGSQMRNVTFMGAMS